MTKQETELILQILETAYPQFYRGKSPDDKRAALRLWADMFADRSGVQVAAAVKAYIATDTRGFPPSIGQINERLVQLTTPELLSEQEAWALVSRAIRKSSYRAAEAFAELPELLQRVVASPSVLHTWAMTAHDDLETVVASNFMRSYRARAARAKESAALPGDIRTILERQEVVRQLPDAPDTAAQQQRVIAQLAADRESMQREMLGDKFDQIGGQQ